ncbi:beta clamp domain-containing protein, partial [Staphylococcus epidermidis]
MMEFTIKRDYFINQLNDTLKAISPRTTLPILTGIKIDAKDNEVILTGSDSEISIEITIPKQVDGEEIVEITETGSVVLPGRFFVDIIKKLPGKEVKLSTNEQFQTLITSGHSEFNLSGLDPDQYPLLPEVSRDDAIQLPVKELKISIAKTNLHGVPPEHDPGFMGESGFKKKMNI